MITSKNANYQRNFRIRRKAMGLVQKTLYILPEYNPIIGLIEKALQKPNSRITLHHGEDPLMSQTLWTTSTLYQALLKTEHCQKGLFNVDLILGLESVIHIELDEYGDLPVQIAVAGGQIMVSAILWPKDAVQDTALFNELALRANPLHPLSNIGLISADGVDLYVLFGELSASSDITQIVEEIETLGNNTLDIVADFRHLLIKQKEN